METFKMLKVALGEQPLGRTQVCECLFSSEWCEFCQKWLTVGMSSTTQTHETTDSVDELVGITTFEVT